MSKHIERRDFLKLFGTGAAAVTAALAGCKGKDGTQQPVKDDYNSLQEPPKDQMTYRTNPTTGDKVSLLGYGMMRLPNREGVDEIDQEMVNTLVDYALKHGVNYFDTSPAYCRGFSERSTGIALSRHPRNSYFIATKLSNFGPPTWKREESIKMFENSLKELQTDYIDYYLLHGCGMGGMDALRGRYLDNGILDFCIEQREKGRIRNLGFSYHGDVKVFDYLLSRHDEIHWDFVQIELNYLDWDYANEINGRNTDARYLYAELQKRGIPAVIMEPLLGGRLANIPQYLMERLKERDPEATIASWAFRYAGTPEGVLTVLSGMTYMEHLRDNLLTYSPLHPVSEEEEEFLYDIAYHIVNVKLIPCNDCKYCMPCPYGVDIPSIFVHYNKVKSHDRLPEDVKNKYYARLRREFLVGQDRSVPRLRQAAHCIGCGQCMSHCPQNIRIPDELHKIDEFVEILRREEA
jgi:predicted aldo/keto reductase-like oxidoreductase